MYSTPDYNQNIAIFLKNVKSFYVDNIFCLFVTFPFFVVLSIIEVVDFFFSFLFFSFFILYIIYIIITITITILIVIIICITIRNILRIFYEIKPYFFRCSTQETGMLSLAKSEILREWGCLPAIIASIMSGAKRVRLIILAI